MGMAKIVQPDSSDARALQYRLQPLEYGIRVTRVAVVPREDETTLVVVRAEEGAMFLLAAQMTPEQCQSPGIKMDRAITNRDRVLAPDGIN